MLSLKKAYTFELLLPQGTRILYRNRAKNDRHKIEFECRECFKESRQVKYVKDNQLGSYVRGVLGVYALLLWVETGNALAWSRLCLYLKRIRYWDELCSDCASARGSLLKFTGRVASSSGTATYFNDEEDGKVLVVYEDLKDGCGCKRRVNRETAISWCRRYPAVCKYHRNHFHEYLELIQARQVTGGEQMVSAARTQALHKAINAVTALWKVVRNNPRPFDKRLLLITQLDLAPELGIHGQDDKTKRTQVAAWLKRNCDLDSIFSESPKWFRDFVETVVREIERGSTPEAIVESLQLRLSRARTAA
jgi:hypothetical protein